MSDDYRIEKNLTENAQNSTDNFEGNDQYTKTKRGTPYCRCLCLNLKTPDIIKRVFLDGTYEPAFLGTLTSVYVCGGMMVLFQIVLIEIFRTDYGLDLDTIQVIMVFVKLPWDYKIFYGVICDTVRIPISQSFV